MMVMRALCIAFVGRTAKSTICRPGLTTVVKSGYTVSCRFKSDVVSNVVRAQKLVLAKHFEGLAKENDFKLVEEDIRPIRDGEILLKAEYLTVDPYMRPMSGSLEIGDTLMGEQTAKVVESKNDKYPVGTNVLCRSGWTTYSISDGIDPGFLPEYSSPLRILDFPAGISNSVALGVLGMPGVSAYFGLLDICKPKEDETVFVNAASGAVGSIVGQIAKIKGAKTIGCAGTDEKVGHLKEYGYDEVFNYKTEDLDKALKRRAPNGIDCYFDNVGGIFSSKVWQYLNVRARVAICGAISQYNNLEDMDKVPANEIMIIFKLLTIKGLLFCSHQSQFPKAYAEMLQWLQEGKLKHKECVTEGFENMPKAFISLFTGENKGKAIVKV
ncbi:prostaglandin reductase 1-like [Glandiceps talaboti]